MEKDTQTTLMLPIDEQIMINRQNNMSFTQLLEVKFLFKIF